MKKPQYTVRVYGILCSSQGRILLLNESFRDRDFTKFPGGGMQHGEGTLDALKRELKEELDLEGLDFQHFYTTDHYQESAFHKDTQVLSIYYLISNRLNENEISLQTDDPNLNSLNWVSIQDLNESHVTFPIDKIVVGLLHSQSAFND